MLKMNFVPDDYIQNNESRRTNRMCLVLLMVVMAALSGSFMTIKMRQRAFRTKEKVVNEKMARAKEAIKQFEELQKKRKLMIKTALTTAELLEPVPRSVLLASLTNNLPAGVSLLQLKLVQKEPKNIARAVATSKYQAAKAEKTAAAQPQVSRENLLETHIDIKGIAPSDLQVAAYIERLSSSTLLDDVALVQSKEHKIRAGTRRQSRASKEPDTTFRQFRLTAMLRKDVQLAEEDVNRIRTKRNNVVFN